MSTNVKTDRAALRDVTNVTAANPAPASTSGDNKPSVDGMKPAIAVLPSAPAGAHDPAVVAENGSSTATTSTSAVAAALANDDSAFHDAGSKRRRSAEGVVKGGAEPKEDTQSQSAMPVQLGVQRTASMMVEEASRKNHTASLLPVSAVVDSAAITKAFTVPDTASDAAKLSSAWLAQSLVGLMSAIQNTQRALPTNDSDPALRAYAARMSRLEEAIATCISASSQTQNLIPLPVMNDVPGNAIGDVVVSDSLPIITDEHREANLSATVRTAFEVLQRREKEHPVHDYRSHQTQVSPHMRSVLVDWMREVAAEHKIHDDTYFLAVRLVDRLLTVVPVPRRELQLVGAVCVLLAAKLEEMHPLPINNFEFLCDRLYNRAQFLTMENVIMRKLGYQLHPPFVHKFVGELVSGLKFTTRMRYICEYVSFVTVLDFTLSTCVSPSLVAAAIVACVANAELGSAQPLFDMLPSWCHGEIARIAHLVYDAWRKFHDRWCVNGAARPLVPAEPLPSSPQGQEIPLCRSAFERFNTAEKQFASRSMARLNPVFEGIEPAKDPVSEPQSQ